MGAAYDRDGNMLGEVEAATKREVFEKLNAAHPTAEEIRIKTLTARDLVVPERLSLQNVDEAFRYQPWDEAQQAAGTKVRDVLVAAAKVILETVPETPSRTRALNNLVDARMLANAAITFRGRF